MFLYNVLQICFFLNVSVQRRICLILFISTSVNSNPLKGNLAWRQKVWHVTQDSVWLLITVLWCWCLNCSEYLLYKKKKNSYSWCVLEQSMRTMCGQVINPVRLASSSGTWAGQTQSPAEASGMPGTVGESGGRAGAGCPDTERPRWAADAATERGREREESEWRAPQRVQPAASGPAPGGERYFFLIDWMVSLCSHFSDLHFIVELEMMNVDCLLFRDHVMISQ